MTKANQSVKVSVLEERVNNMQAQNSTDHERILEEIAKINKKFDDTFVTKHEFAPVKAIAYSLITLTCTAVVGAVIKLVVK
jgi:hypothetical protein